MQAILSVDITSNPAILQVLQVQDRSVEVMESHSVLIGDLFSKNALLGNTSSPASSEQEQTEESPSNEENAFDTPSDIPTPESKSEEAAASNQLAEAIKAIVTPWTTSIALVPTYEYLSLNLDLPFGDAKNLGKILDLEIQDRVPFDVSEFHIEHKSISQLPSKAFDIHVSLIPKIFMQRVLKTLRESGIEPYIMSTPASVLDALFFLAPQYYSGEAAVIFAQDPSFYIATRFDGQLRSERIIVREAGSFDGTDSDAKRILTDIKLTLAAAETRYQKRIEHVYLIGESLSANEIQNALGRQVEKVELSELVQSKGNPATIASLAGVYAQDTHAPEILTNFRTREFSYSPQLRELMFGLKRLLPFFGALMLCAGLALGGIYFFRDRQIQQMRRILRERIQAALPQTTLPESGEVGAVLSENFTIEQQLKDLGSPSRYSALDILLEISRDFPTLPDVTVRSLSIRGNQIKIEGSSQNYAAVENIQKALKASKTGYCRVEKDTPSSGALGSNVRAFSFDLRLCE